MGAIGVAAMSLPWIDSPSASASLAQTPAELRVDAHLFYAATVKPETLRALARSDLGDIAFLAAAGLATHFETARALSRRGSELALGELATERDVRNLLRSIDAATNAAVSSLGASRIDKVLLVGVASVTPAARALAAAVRAAKSAQVELCGPALETSPPPPDYSGYIRSARAAGVGERELCLPLPLDGPAETITAHAAELAERYACTRFRAADDVCDDHGLARLTEALDPLVVDQDLDIQSSCTLRFTPSAEQAARMRRTGVLKVHLDAEDEDDQSAFLLAAGVRDLHALGIDVSWAIGSEGASALHPALAALTHLPVPEVTLRQPPGEAGELVDDWRRRHLDDSLVVRRGPGYVEIVDRRARADRIVTLAGVQVAVYDACVTPVQETDVVSALRSDAKPEVVRALLESLISERLLARSPAGWLLAPACRSGQGRQPQHDPAVRAALSLPRNLDGPLPTRHGDPQLV